MKKLILMPLVFILTLTIAFANDFAFSQNQFGNTNIIGITSGSLVLSSPPTIHNRTLCQPFKAYKTGTIRQIYMQGSNNDCALAWCLSSSYTEPKKETCDGVGANLSSQWMGIPENISFPVTEGNLYVLCIGVDDSVGGSSCSLATYSGVSGFSDDIERYIKTTTPISDYSLPDKLPSDNLTYSIVQRYYDSNGVLQTDWTEANRLGRSLQYCYEIDDDCYLFLPQVGATTTLNNPSGSGLVGEIFYYPFQTSTVTDVSLVVAKGTSISDSDKFQIQLWEWDWATNTTGASIYNSSDYYGANISGTLTWNLINHSVSGNPTLENGKYYILGIRCTLGCSSNLAERFHLLDYAVKSEEWFDGYGKNDSVFYVEGNGGIYPDDDGWFLITMADTLWSPPQQSNATNITNCTTTCDEWTLPYYLKESFNGLINTCGWATTENICFYGTLNRTSTDYFSAFKENDLLQETDSRYFTVSFDILPSNIASNGWLSLSLYDADFTKYIQFLIGESGKFYNNNNGNAELVYSNVSTTQIKNVQLHVDFSSDDYDLYYNGNKVKSSLAFSNNLFNAENLNGIRISSKNAIYVLDNLTVFATDQNNNMIVTDSDFVGEEVDRNIRLCSLIYDYDIECVTDDDCPTDNCLVNGKCGKFDMNYCDEHAIRRGNYCLVAGTIDCFVSNTRDIILDHFLETLVVVALLIGVGYVVYFFRR